MLFAVVLFLLALGLTLYPVISNYVNQKYASQIQTEYQEIVEQADDSEIQEVKEKAHAYNLALVPGATDAYSQEGLLAAAEDYDAQFNIAGNGIMGYVEIPKISVNLPIYHGAENDSLERGIGHLLGSSLPVGGENTHTILSGHSGMATQKMFTDLEQLVQGDVFYLRVLDETLAYQVTEINTVLPHDTSLLGIVSGEDLCTLVTCTPYGVNSHRLLVRGHRVADAAFASAGGETAPTEAAPAAAAPVQPARRPTPSRGAWWPVLLIALAVPAGFAAAAWRPSCRLKRQAKGRHLRGK